VSQADIPKETRRPFYKRDPITTPLLVLLVYFASQVGAGLLVSLYPTLKNWTSEQGTAWLQESLSGQFIFYLLAELFVVWMVLGLIKGIKVSRAKIGLVWPKLKHALYMFGGYAVYFLVFITVASLASGIVDGEQQQQIGFDAAVGGQLWLVFISLVILPPIAEEILFRGFLFTSLRQKYKFLGSAIATSVLFGIAHLQFGTGAPPLWIAAIDTFVLSMVLCYLREKTGSLGASIGLHALKNLIAFVVLFHDKF